MRSIQQQYSLLRQSFSSQAIRTKFQILILFLCFAAIFCFLSSASFGFTHVEAIAKYAFSNKDLSEYKSAARTKFGTLLADWNKCMLPQMSPLRGQPNKLWDSFPAILDTCREVYQKELQLEGIENHGEIKYHVFYKKGAPKMTVVTLGVGGDTLAENKLKNRTNGNADFFAADPIIENNEQLFKQIGSFFPFAVGAEAGLSKASVLLDGYVEKTVIHIDMIYFLKNVLRKKFVDVLWMDNEGAEFALFPVFYKGGELEQNGITICQINMEIHFPNDEKRQKTHDFLFRLFEEKRYVFLHSSLATHMRLYFLNVDSEECINNY